MQISLQQIREMAPDSKSISAAEKLLSPRIWQAAMSETAIWGLCGGGRNYRIAVDLVDMGFRCNCPSRKFPCKHVLALLMLFASSPDQFVLEVHPDWVEEWLAKRKQKRERQRSQEATPAKPVDSVAQSKRIEAREQNVRAGINQFIHWLDDIIRTGIATLESKPFSFWDTQARRLIDSQAKGLSNRVRMLSEIPGSSSDWANRMLDELGKLRLLLHAYQRLDELSPDLQSEVRQLIGWNVSQDALEKNNDVVSDRWFIWGQRVEEDERLRTQRSWAIGIESHREAMILQFAPGRQAFPESIITGTTLNGEFLFYPGTDRQRAKILSREEANIERAELPTNRTIAEYLNSYAERLAINPWFGTCACLLSDVTLTHYQNRWWIRDNSGDALSCKMKVPFKLLSQTGGKPIQIHAEWNGRFLSPLSFQDNERFEQC